MFRVEEMAQNWSTLFYLQEARVQLWAPCCHLNIAKHDSNAPIKQYSHAHTHTHTSRLYLIKNSKETGLKCRKDGKGTKVP